MRSTGRSRTIGLAAGAAILLAIYLVSPVSNARGDAKLAIADAWSLVHDGDAQLDELADVPGLTSHFAFRRVDGRSVDYFPWWSGALAVPAVLAVDGAHTLGAGPGIETLLRRDDPSLDALQRIVAAVYAALTATVLASAALVLLRRATPDGTHLGAISAATIVVLIGTATPLWSTVSRAMWQHVPATLALAVALRAAVSIRSSERPARLTAIAASAATLAVWARPAAVFVTVPLLVGVALAAPTARRAGAVSIGGALVAGAVLNRVLTGDVFPLYVTAKVDEGELDLAGTYAEAVAANLLSPARGLLVYSGVVVVGVVLAVRRADAEIRRWAWVAAGGIVISVLGVSATPAYWWAGHSYGPRFMTEALVLATPCAAVGVVLAIRRTNRTWTAVVAATAMFAILVHGAGATSADAQCWNAWPRSVDGDPSRVWDWDDPPFLRPVGATHAARAACAGA